MGMKATVAKLEMSPQFTVGGFVRKFTFMRSGDCCQLYAPLKSLFLTGSKVFAYGINSIKPL